MLFACRLCLLRGGGGQEGEREGEILLHKVISSLSLSQFWVKKVNTHTVVRQGLTPVCAVTDEDLRTNRISQQNLVTFGLIFMLHETNTLEQIEYGGYTLTFTKSSKYECSEDQQMQR